jgi:hypothetical protein
MNVREARAEDLERVVHVQDVLGAITLLDEEAVRVRDLTLTDDAFVLRVDRRGMIQQYLVVPQGLSGYPRISAVALRLSLRSYSLLTRGVRNST